ncbi:hypothetical protein CR970_01330 [Candidatus Saccharibacteria bacterium]|nr:MAG: hypothetical protein CR970_01330 [Candidatus Saccharibacteria bacterium]
MTAIKNHGEIDTAAKVIADWRSIAIVHAIYEYGPIRYSRLASMLGFSPTVLSQKLATLNALGIISRTQHPGAKQVTYAVEPVARRMVRAFHLLEDVNKAINKEGI